MLSKKTKKIIFFSVINILGLLFAYWIYSIKTPILAAQKQNFTSVSSGILSDANNVWAVVNANSNAYLAKLDLKGKIITIFAVQQESELKTLLPLGSNIWVTNFNQGTVDLINTENGSLSQQINLGYESMPWGMAFDGTNVWVCNYGKSSCTVLNQGSGSIVSTVTIGQGPTCALFDSQYIWITCTASQEAYVINPASLTLVNKFNIGIQPTRMTSVNGTVYVLNTAPDENGKFFVNILTINGIQGNIELNTDPYVDITNDGKDLYLLSSNGNVHVYSSSGNPISSFQVGGMTSQYFNLINNTLFIYDINHTQLAVYSKGGSGILPPTVLSQP
jgi:hypothetical protein